MTNAPDFVNRLLGWRSAGVPNTADSHSRTSIGIAAAMLSILGIDKDATGPQGDPGVELEVSVMRFLEETLPDTDVRGHWDVDRRRLVTDFTQYEHLARLQALIDSDESGTLASEIGTDYVIRPDITVGIRADSGVLHLHAAISCKWTIRSDRVQNIRHEGVVLTRHRRGRQPHISTVTAEPLPTRIAAIARGTGEVDTVYHIALDVLARATELAGTVLQQSTFEELVIQRRLSDVRNLPRDLLI